MLYNKAMHADCNNLIGPVDCEQAFSLIFVSSFIGSANYQAVASLKMLQGILSYVVVAVGACCDERRIAALKVLSAETDCEQKMIVPLVFKTTKAT